MDRKVIKRFIIGMAICVIVIIIILIIMLLRNNTTEENQMVEEEPSLITEKPTSYEEIISQYDYFVVSNCVNTYLSAINKENSSYYGFDENNNYTKVVPQEEIAKKVLNVLNNKYIEEKSITTENVYDYVADVKENLLFVPIEMKTFTGENANSYAIYGYTINYDYNFVDDVYLIINLDINNKTFSVVPIDEETYKGEMTSYDEQIGANEYNKFSYMNLSEEYKLKEYFKYYKWMMLSNADIAYERLDETYREKRFGSIDEFKQYINNNRQNIIGRTIEEYDSNSYDEYQEFVEKDQYSNYYIFKLSENNANDFTVMLDTYIVGTKETQDKYAKASNQEKVAINTMRFISSINEKNYDYAYTILADSFKQNNFPNQSDFETYVKNNMYEKNNVESSDFSEDGGYYIYNLKISDGNGQTKSMDVIMQLKEGTDFVMSFSVE